MACSTMLLTSGKAIYTKCTQFNSSIKKRYHHQIKEKNCKIKPVFSTHTGFKLALNNKKITTRCRASVRPKIVPANDSSSASEVVPVKSQATETEKFSADASKQLSMAISMLKKFGWIGFWVQLTLSITSAAILLFSVAYAVQTGPKVSFYATTVGVAASFISVFQFFGLVSLSRQLRRYFEAPLGAAVKKITKEKVLNAVSQGICVAVIGLGSSIFAMQAAVGVLIAKTLTNSTANPFLAGGQGAWNPVLAFDIFLLQSSTNTLMSHFIGIFIGLWMLVQLRRRNLWTILFGPSASSSA